MMLDTLRRRFAGAKVVFFFESTKFTKQISYFCIKIRTIRALRAIRVERIDFMSIFLGYTTICLLRLQWLLIEAILMLLV